MNRPFRSTLFIIAALLLVVNPLSYITVMAMPQAQVSAAENDDDATPPPAKKPLTIERIFSSPPLGGSGPSQIQWMADSRAVSFINKEGVGDDAETVLMMAKVPTGKRSVLCVVDTITVPPDLRKSDDAAFKIGAYHWAKTGNRMVFSFAGEIFTFHSESRTIKRHTRTDAKETNVTFSPDGKKISFNRNNDLWLIDIESGEETQLTTTGSDSLLNGILDWVYMEELFTRGNVQGYWWSNDGKRIAYLQIDESPVPEFALVDFKPLHNTVTMQHYPKAGDPIPIVRVGVYDFEKGETTWMDVDTTDDTYLARLYWVGDNKHVAIEKINRAQDTLRVLLANVETGAVTQIMGENKPTWINITYLKHFYENKNQFVWGSDRTGNTHLYLYRTDGALLRQLTDGRWEVAALNNVDERRGNVYFTALESSLLGRQLYRVSDTGGGIELITRRPGTHNVTFAPNDRYYFDRFSDINTPSVISVHDVLGKELFKLFASDMSELAQYDIPTTNFLRFKDRNGFEFQCQMTKPSDFDKTKKYPVIVYVYGGPHRQVVRNMWNGTRGLWHAYMASRGYIVFSLDNRGSYGRGARWEDPILESMGHVELEDQLSGVEYLKTLSYVDDERIGIWGWSYGGYMTSMAMFKRPGAFKIGAAIAPVSDWRYYDSIYTERYMKHPDDNKEGYHQSSPIHFVDGLDAPFFLAHGAADDNVHVQNTINLADALIKAGKDFDFMLYPGKKHGISGKKYRVHLFTKLTKFFDENL